MRHPQFPVLEPARLYTYTNNLAPHTHTHSPLFWSLPRLYTYTDDIAPHTHIHTQDIGHGHTAVCGT